MSGLFEDPVLAPSGTTSLDPRLPFDLWSILGLVTADRVARQEALTRWLRDNRPAPVLAQLLTLDGFHVERTVSAP